MADERWLDELSKDPDLTAAAGDDVDRLIESTLAELEDSDRRMEQGRAETPTWSWTRKPTKRRRSRPAGGAAWRRAGGC